MLANVRPGAIVLMHDGGGDRQETLRALPAILRALQRRHLKVVTLSRMLAKGATGNRVLERFVRRRGRPDQKIICESCPRASTSPAGSCRGRCASPFAAYARLVDRTAPGADRPVFAVIVPMVAIRDDAHAALSLSLGRTLGVIAGVLLGIAVVAVAGVSTSAIVLLLVIGLAVGLFLRTGPELNTQIAISALLVLDRDPRTRTTTRSSASGRRAWARSCRSLVAAFVLPPDPLRERRAPPGGVRRPRWRMT